MSNRVGGFIGQDGLNAPDEPTNVAGTAGDQQVDVSFTAPSDVGGSAITGYRAQSNDGIGASGSASPITVTGLTNDTAYTFRVWAINAFGYSAPSDASGSVTPYAPRVLFAGGNTSAAARSSAITYINPNTTGNAQNFGNLSATNRELASCASSTRAVFAGGDSATGMTNVIQYLTFATLSNTTDFGDLLTNSFFLGGLSNSTRGLFFGGYNASSVLVNTIQYITIASVGDSTDFGDLVYGNRSGINSGFASSTRGIMCANSAVNSINYVTIASVGNAIDFGDLLNLSDDRAGCSSSTRGLIAGGSGPINVIQYITITSTGNATDFGDLAVSRYGLSASSTETRGIFSGGFGTARVNVIDYVTIASAGNATDFGDLTVALYVNTACSNVHGGLS